MKYYSRFIVLGDSFSEGIGDEVHPQSGHHRGWADRVADGLAAHDPNFTYLNLSIRGKLIGQVAEDQVPIALRYSTYGNVLVSFHAGMNDLLRPSYNHAVVSELYIKSVRAIRATGADVILFTVAEPFGAKGRAADRLALKISGFNDDVRKVATETRAILIEADQVSILKDPRLWDRDRLHLNSEGHRRVAGCVLEALGYSQESSWSSELPLERTKPKALAVWQDIRWVISFLIPWIWRRLRGRSSGDGRSSKQDEPTIWGTPK